MGARRLRSTSQSCRLHCSLIPGRGELSEGFRRPARSAENIRLSRAESRWQAKVNRKLDKEHDVDLTMKRNLGVFLWLSLGMMSLTASSTDGRSVDDQVKSLLQRMPKLKGKLIARRITLKK